MKRIVLSIVMMLGLIATSSFAASAQPTVSDSSFTSALTGDVVDLGGSGGITFIEENYELSEGRVVSEEYIWFTFGWSNFELVLITGVNDAQNYYDLTVGNMEEFYESFEIIEDEITEDHAWFIANAEYQGSPLVVYYDFQLDAIGETDIVVMQFTAADSLAADLEFVQEEVTVGGIALLPGIDAQALGSSVEGTASVTPVADEVATPARGDGIESGLNDLILNTSEVDGTPEDETSAASPTSETDWESMGLVSDTEWVSPGFGASVTWDDATWTFPVDYEYAIYLNDDPMYDVITLETIDGLGYVFITVEETGSNTPTSLVQYWTSPDYADTFDIETTVVETATTPNTASVVYETLNTLDQPLFVVLTATVLEDGTTVYTQVSASPDTIHDVYGQFVNGVELNGAPLDLTYTVEDILEIGGN